MLELEQKIADLCNQSGLPFEAIYFVLKDLWRDAEATMQKALADANSSQEKQQEEE